MGLAFLGGLSTLVWLVSLRYPPGSTRTIQQICYSEAPTSPSGADLHEVFISQRPVDWEWDVEAPQE